MSRILINNDLWKSVENVSAHFLTEFPAGQPPDCSNPGIGDAFGPPLRACSACAGDYEDPDRTAGSPVPETEDETEPRGTCDPKRDKQLTGTEDERNSIKFPSERR